MFQLLVFQVKSFAKFFFSSVLCVNNSVAICESPTSPPCSDVYVLITFYNNDRKLAHRSLHHGKRATFAKATWENMLRQPLQPIPMTNVWAISL